MIMNPDTLVAVCGYAGDLHQIRHLMPYYLHHQCKVLILSPVGSPIVEGNLTRHPSVIYRQAGERAYIGPTSLEREKQHIRVMLEYPFKHILMHDSDSVCLSSKIPQYLYEKDVFWSNEASDMMHTMPEGYSFPRYAAQPPYFCSRGILEQMSKACDLLPFEDMRLQFIDHYLMRLCAAGNIPHSTFYHGVSCPTTNDAPGVAHMLHEITNFGATMLHAIKDKKILMQMAHARVGYLRRNARA